MSTLHVLLPPLTHAGEVHEFRTWLAHGDRLPALPAARDASLRALFRFGGDSIPVAALRRHAIADDAGSGAWLAADPVYVRSEATGARLLAWPLVDLTAGEVASLAAAIRPLCGDGGTPLAVDTPSAWCLHLPAGAPVASFADPSEALGVDLLDCLPQGDAGRTWRRLFNEIQVTLHAHPVNAARIAAGQLPVNALWLWGAGALPGAVETGLCIVAGDDPMVHGLARLAHIPWFEPSPSALERDEAFGRGGDALLDLDAPGRPGNAGPWLAHFRRWLREQRFAAIGLTFADGQRVRLRHRHRLRFWRRG